MDTIEVVIDPGSESARSVLEQLKLVEDPASGWSAEVRYPELRFRSIDAAVLVAIVGAAGSTFTALVASLLQIVGTKGGRRISIELKSGGRLDVPADTSPDKLRQLIASLDERPSRILLP